MNKNYKIEAFEYTLFRLLLILDSNNFQNDLSILKVMKLLFFISTANTKKRDENRDCLDVFDNYVAMPYGPVEIDIYNAIKCNRLERFSINNSFTEFIFNEEVDENSFEISEEDKLIIDNSIIKLYNLNNNIFNMNAFDLVDLSHEWSSWKYYFDLARRQFSAIKSIPVEVIRNEEKIYSARV